MQDDERTGDNGRSRERERQDRLLDREARRESWLERLLRQRSFEKGRPASRNDDTLDRSKDG